MLLSALDGATVIFMVGLVVVSGLLMSRSYRYFRRQAQSKPSGPRLSAAANVEPPADVQRWEVSMHGLARDTAARLDTKMSLLQRLILDAEAAAERLEAALQSSETAVPVDCALHDANQRERR